jgi:hypothetical protein
MRLKSELYKNEQLEIMNKIINILELDKNNSITLYELDNDIIKQQKILNMLNDIKKYFKCQCVKSLIAPEKVKRIYLSLIRYITKLEYNMISSQHLIHINNSTIRTVKYIFIKKSI